MWRNITIQIKGEGWSCFIEKKNITKPVPIGGLGSFFYDAHEDLLCKFGLVLPLFCSMVIEFVNFYYFRTFSTKRFSNMFAKVKCKCNIHYTYIIHEYLLLPILVRYYEIA